MLNSEHVSCMKSWLADVRTYFVHCAPDLVSLFDTYAAEAVFGRQYIASDLALLDPGAKVLEIGAGSLLLSCQLVQEGFEVTGLEPIGTGFSHFERMRQIILARATTLGCLPQIINLAAEALKEKNSFEYAFSINVMEHVNEVERVLANVADSLKVGAIYRFTCPNYTFPYEPHFDIFTLFSKRLTEKLRHQKIFGSNKMLDPSGTWASLNWINVVQVRSFAKRLPGIKVSFNNNILVSTLDRLTFDKSFASRRSSTMRTFLVMLVRLRLHELFRFVPAMFQPIMDCRVEKVLDMESVK